MLTQVLSFFNGNENQNNQSEDSFMMAMKLKRGAVGKSVNCLFGNGTLIMMETYTRFIRDFL